MARKKIREYDSKRLLKEHLKRIAGIDLQNFSAQVSSWDLDLVFCVVRDVIGRQLAEKFVFQFKSGNFFFFLKKTSACFMGKKKKKEQIGD